MAEKDDVIAATSGVDSMVRMRKKPRWWGRSQGNELSALLLEKLGLPEGNVTIEVPTGELKTEGLAATVKVTKLDGTEIDGSEVAQALQKINIKLGDIKTWLIRSTVIGVITFIIGLIGGELGWAGKLLAYFAGSTDPVTPYIGFFMW